MLHWNIQLPLKTCFIGGLLDHCKRKISGSGSWICHCILNQTIQPYFNIVTMTSLITRAILLIRACVMTEPCTGNIENIREEPPQLYTRLFCRGSAVGVSHSSCVASLLPAAVAGWCLRCLLGGLCPRYSSTWLWVSQSEPFVYADRMRWLLTWKKWPRRVVL